MSEGRYYVMTRQGRTDCGTSAAEAMDTAMLTVDATVTTATVYREGSREVVARYEWDPERHEAVETTVIDPPLAEDLDDDGVVPPWEEPEVGPCPYKVQNGVFHSYCRRSAGHDGEHDITTDIRI